MHLFWSRFLFSFCIGAELVGTVLVQDTYLLEIYQSIIFLFKMLLLFITIVIVIFIYVFYLE